MHVHLDPVGGIAGDMFIAAVLDAWPELAGALEVPLRAAGLPEEVDVRLLAHRDHALAGSRFVVEGPGTAPALAGAHDAGHAHVHWRDLRRRLERAPLAAGVGERALAIFGHLAEAEARAHGVEADDVDFHEVGAWDSVADVVGAAHLIEALGAASWSISPLPVGSGRVESAHGLLPVPAPATVALLEGRRLWDDGLPGERVTPTGAAIVRHLAPEDGLGGLPRRLLRSGLGFGQRRLPGLSNVLRLLAFEGDGGGAGEEELAVVSFEVDDQTAEDLAVALGRLRALEGVRDAVQSTVAGKKGRLMTRLEVLATPGRLDAVVDACWRETTTLGVRWRIERRRLLERRVVSRDEAAAGVRVKVARLPGGETAKAEIDDLAAAAGGHAGRDALRRRAETSTLGASGLREEGS